MKKIKVIKNGPYLVSGNVPLEDEKIINDAEGYPIRWEKTKDYPTSGEFKLCRCGRSETKPFCDGEHQATGFECQETASFKQFEEQAEKIVGPDLILKDAVSLCVSAKFCDRAGGIWDLVENPANPEAKKIAIEEAANCPSGRLVVEDKTSKQAIEPKFRQIISTTQDADGIVGPYWVKGGIAIESVEGKTYETRNRMTLCQCGKSRNKPFCDGSHYQS